MLALVAYLVERGVREPFLIAAPAAVVANWEREAAAWLPGLTCVAYKGNAATRADIFDSQVSQGHSLPHALMTAFEKCAGAEEVRTLCTGLR